MNSNERNAVTAESFIKKLWKGYLNQQSDSAHQENLESQMSYQEFISSGIVKGWLTNDFLSQSFPDCKNIARVIHEFIKKERKEADEDDISPATKLKDLYDCHSCVNHIAQVYVKGIMEADEINPLVFGTTKYLQEEKAELVIQRIFHSNLRKLPIREASAKKVSKLSLQEAMKLIQNKDMKLIDVRSRQEYEKNHLKGAYHISLSEILRNPYQVSEKRETPILFYCEQAYQSQIAANCVADAGFSNVVYFGIGNSLN